MADIDAEKAMLAYFKRPIPLSSNDSTNTYIHTYILYINIVLYCKQILKSKILLAHKINLHVPNNRIHFQQIQQSNK